MSTPKVWYAPGGTTHFIIDAEDKTGKIPISSVRNVTRGKDDAVVTIYFHTGDSIAFSFKEDYYDNDTDANDDENDAAMGVEKFINDALVSTADSVMVDKKDTETKTEIDTKTKTKTETALTWWPLSR